MSNKLVVVCGATGGQGGSVVKALLADGRFAIRGLTRDVDSAASKALAAQGVEMVFGLPADKDTLLKAFKGAYAVFGVTIPGFVPGPPNDYDQGKNIVDACKANDVPLFVWSSLPHVSESSGGKYTMVTAFDQKAEVDKYIKSVEQPAVVLKTGGFVSNTINFRQLRRDSQDPEKLHLFYPWVRGTSPTYITDVDRDLGPSVVAVINNWENPELKRELQKEPIAMVSYYISGEEKAQIISKVTGKECDYIREEATEGFNAHPALKQMYAWVDGLYVKYPGGVPSPLLVKLGVKFHTYEDYVRENALPWLASQ